MVRPSNPRRGIHRGLTDNLTAEGGVCGRKIIRLFLYSGGALNWAEHWAEFTEDLAANGGNLMILR